MARALTGIALLGTLACASHDAFAQSEPAAEPSVASPAPAASAAVAPAGPASPVVHLHYDSLLDVPITTVLAAGLITYGVAIKPNLDAPTCTICDGANGKINPIDNFFRKTFRQGPTSPAGTVSDVLAYGVAPGAGVVLTIAAPAYDGRANEAPLDLLLVVEASLTFAVLQQGLTALLPRERPAVHAAQGDERESALTRHSSFESFPAGHNGSAFAIAAAGGTIATMRGYRLAPLVWIVGGTIALATSYLRIAADRHYFSDITTGAGLGIACGIGVPLLFHRPVSERPSAALRWLQGATVSTTEVPGGRIVGIGWLF